MSSSNETDSVVHHSHGNSVAAWVAVAVITLGSIAMTIAVVARSMPMFVIGTIVAVVGGLAAPVLSAMGLGEQPAEH